MTSLSRHQSTELTSPQRAPKSASTHASVASGLAPTDGKPQRRKRGCARFVENLSQQKLKAWQPVLTPKWVVTIFLGLGVVFLGLGILLLMTSDKVIECQVEYEDPEKACDNVAECTSEYPLTITEGNCVGLKSAEIAPPVFVYYRLKKFYQNHRRYVKSRDDGQLRGEIKTSADDLSTCDPLVKDPNDDSKILLPCGLIAWSVFNDSFVLNHDDNTPYDMDESAATIAWEGDLKKFSNPASVDATKVTDWMNTEIFPEKMENGHFIVWMRVAALPDFRKLYGKIEETVTLPLKLVVSSRYPVAAFKGQKFVVLSQTSWLGGRNSFLGISYLFIGSLWVVFGIFFIGKNHHKRRLLGDVRELNATLRR